MNNIYPIKPLKERQGASQALTTSVPAKNDDLKVHKSKRTLACRSENTGSSASPNVGNHTVFVLDIEGRPLTPTTSAKARKLIKGKQAKQIWSKFNTFGIQLLIKTRKDIPDTCLGYDPGSKFEGLSIIVDKENNLNVKLDLPNKSKIIGTKKGKVGQLCGEDRNSYRYYDSSGKRQATRSLSWINSQFNIKLI